MWSFEKYYVYSTKTIIYDIKMNNYFNDLYCNYCIALLSPVSDCSLCGQFYNECKVMQFELYYNHIYIVVTHSYRSCYVQLQVCAPRYIEIISTSYNPIGRCYFTYNRDLQGNFRVLSPCNLLSGNMGGKFYKITGIITV